MKKLFISIILTVVASLFVIGWGLDYIVGEFSQQSDDALIIDNQTEYYHSLINGFSTHLSLESKDSLTLSVIKLSSSFNVDLRLELSKDLALPDSLQPSLKQDGGILLGSYDSAYILKSIDKHPEYLLQLVLPPLNEDVRNSDLFFTVVLYLGVCCLVILWLLPLARRLSILNSAAAKFGSGQLSARIRPSKLSYINTLENSFNRMAGQIEKLIADNKILAGSISHDLRTPMACLRFGLEAAQDSRDLEKKDKYLERMDAELVRMEDLTSAFLEYAGLERKGMMLNIEKVSWPELIRSLINHCQPLADKKSLDLSLVFSQAEVEKLYSQIDRHWMYRAMQNLLANALTYAETKVEISINLDKQGIIVLIEDDGVGIPDDQQNAIFDPFVKLEKSRNRQQGNFGLGLAITKKVMDWHEADIRARSSVNLKGACIEVKIKT